MRKLTVLLVFGLLSALPMTAQEPAAPAAGPVEQAVAAPLENGFCAVENQDVLDLAIFAPTPTYKACGNVTAPCARPAGAGPCQWYCPCPTWDECSLRNANGCTLCVAP